MGWCWFTVGRLNLDCSRVDPWTRTAGLVCHIGHLIGLIDIVENSQRPVGINSTGFHVADDVQRLHRGLHLRNGPGIETGKCRPLDWLF